MLQADEPSFLSCIEYNWILFFTDLESLPCNGALPLRNNITGQDLQCGDDARSEKCPPGSFCHKSISATYAKCCPQGDYSLDSVNLNILNGLTNRYDTLFPLYTQRYDMCHLNLEFFQEVCHSGTVLQAVTVAVLMASQRLMEKMVMDARRHIRIPAVNLTFWKINREVTLYCVG